jgi:hypothetical protein
MPVSVTVVVTELSIVLVGLPYAVSLLNVGRGPVVFLVEAKGVGVRLSVEEPLGAITQAGG